MRITKKITLSVTLVAIVLLPILFVSTNFMSLGSVSTTATMTGDISAVESGTTSTSNWSVGPVPAAVGSSVSVDIRIDGTTPKTIWGWAVNGLNWTASVLQLTKVKQGNFLTDSGDSTLFVGTNPSLWNNVIGSITGGLSCGDSVSATPQTEDTSGVLATLTFKVVSYGVASINLSDAVLLSSSADEGLGGSAGTEVTANNATITANQPPASLIEAFTGRGGAGANPNSGVYGPQDLVQMYALVTYDQASVANQEVSFLVQNPNGTVVDVRVAETNSTGYAYSDYRLPWPDTTTPQVEFGQWSITATTDLSDIAINSTVNFTYNYAVSVANINGITLPTSVVRGSTIYINVTIQNIANQPSWSTVSVTVYDSVDTPIGNYLTSNSVVAGASGVRAPIIIPSWAFIGNATVYVDVLTNTPSADGVPYCPERVAHLQIMP
jgi:hypothetical protein